MTELELVQKALDMRAYSYAPYSHFRVGAALESQDGQVFTGCNVENAAYGSTICAERTALVKAVTEGVTHFRRIAIAGDSEDYCWPCGACRQMLREFGTELEVLVANRNGAYQRLRLDELLPHSFGPATLN